MLALERPRSAEPYFGKRTLASFGRGDRPGRSLYNAAQAPRALRQMTGAEHSFGAVDPSRRPAPGGWWDRLVAPSPHLVSPTARLQARLLAAFTLVLVPVGALSALIQWLVVPGFDVAVVEVLAAVGVMFGAYALARSRHARVGAVLASVVPTPMSVAVGLTTPHDRIWYAFSVLGVLFAGMFVSTRFAALLVAAGAAGIVLVSRLQPAFADPALWVPALFFHVGTSALLIVALRYRDAIADARRRALLDAQAVVAFARRRELVAELSAGLAHDFNNVLAALYGVLDEIEQASPTAPRCIEGLREMTRRVSEMTRRVAALGRPAAGTRGPIDLRAVTNSIAPLLERVCASEDVALAVDLPTETGPWIAGDAALVEHILFNLVTNARDASPAGATVSVSVSQEGDEAVLRVTDRGPGIAPADRVRIFEPFYSTKGEERGSGLGLSVVRRFSQELGGRVEVESRAGVCTTFEVRLPRIEAPRGATALPIDAGTTPGRKKRLLVVDDDPIVARGTARMLEQLGYEVCVVVGGTAALRRLEDPSEAFDGLVTDVSMPDLSGPTLSDRAKALRPSLRVLFVSGQPEDTLIEHGIVPSPINFLAKPFTREALGQAVRRLLG